MSIGRLTVFRISKNPALHQTSQWYVEGRTDAFVWAVSLGYTVIGWKR